MDLTKILAISGKPGLYKMLSQTKAGFVVESLTDGKRFPVFAHERVSTLEEISIFIAGEDDMLLKDVFRKFFDKLEGKPGPDPAADNKTLKSFFLETIPAYDQEKVYVSDMKKTIAWYNLLLEKGLLEFKEGDQGGEGGEGDKGDKGGEGGGGDKGDGTEPSKDNVANETSETDAPAVE
jgi:uncharacterized membrane protein YgcG